MKENIDLLFNVAEVLFCLTVIRIVGKHRVFQRYHYSYRKNVIVPKICFKMIWELKNRL